MREGTQLHRKVWRNSFHPAGQEDTPALLPCRRPGRMDDGQKEGSHEGAGGTAAGLKVLSQAGVEPAVS